MIEFKCCRIQKKTLSIKQTLLSSPHIEASALDRKYHFLFQNHLLLLKVFEFFKDPILLFDQILKFGCFPEQIYAPPKIRAMRSHIFLHLSAQFH